MLVAVTASAASITLTNSDAFNFSSFDTGLNWSDGQAPTNLNDYFTGSFMLRTPTNNSDYTFQGNSLSIDSGGQLNMKGTGVITIANLILDGGTIANGIGAVILNGSINVAAPSTFDTQAAGRTITVNAAISGNGPLTFILGGLTRLNGSNSFTGGMILNGSSVAITNDFNLGAPGSGITFTNGGTLIVTNSFVLKNRDILLNDGGGKIQVETNSLTTLTNVISGTGSLIKLGAGTLTLTAANTYTGETIVSNGFVVLANSAALGATNGGTTVIGSGGSNGSRLVLSNGVTVADALSLISVGTDRVRIVGVNGTNTIAGPINFSSPGAVNVTFDVESGSAMVISGDIIGTGSFGIRGANGNGTLTGSVNISGDLFKTDGSTWTVGAPGKTYSWGNTQIAVGTIRLGTDNVLPATTLLTFGQTGTNNATLDLCGFNQIVSGLITQGIGNHIITNTGVLATFTVSNNATRTFAGRIGGPLNLVKAGTALLNLTGTNTHTGATLINAGTLSVNGISLNSPITVAGGVLGGTGIVANVTIANGGRLSPGNSVGTLTVSNLTLDPGAMLTFELGATNNSDLVVALGTLTLNNQDFSSFTFTTNAGFGIGLYTLIAAVTTSGAFTEVTSTNFFGYSATLALGGTDGNDLTLTVVPEPGAGLLVGAGLLAILVWRRFRGGSSC